jgi:hypothetical protein
MLRGPVLRNLVRVISWLTFFRLYATRHNNFLVVETGRSTPPKRSVLKWSTCLGNMLILVFQRKVMGLDGTVS